MSSTRSALAANDEGGGTGGTDAAMKQDDITGGTDIGGGVVTGQQQTGDRAAFDAKIDVASMVPVLATHINHALNRIAYRPTLTYEQEKLSLQRVNEDGWFECATPDGSTTRQVPLNTELLGDVLGQLFERIR